MELADYLRIVRGRWLLIVLSVVVGVGGALLATAQQTHIYRSSTRLIVSGASSISAVDEIARRELAVQRAIAFAQVGATPPALAAAEAKVGLSGAPVSVQASADGTSPFINLAVSGPNARQAQRIAGAFVLTLPATLQKLDQVAAAAPEELATVAPASYSPVAISPKPKRNVIVGLALGLLLGIGGALVRESLDRRLRDSEDVEAATGIGVLGVIPAELAKERLPAVSSPQSPRVEAYRLVRTNLYFVAAPGATKSILVTSSAAGEGKSSLATNLAVVCAGAGQRVAVVDADLRKPMVHQYFSLPNRVGLTDVLAGRVPVAEAMIATGPEDRVAVLTSGVVPGNPSELLGSQEMASLIRGLESQYDLVIVDSPPVLPVADAVQLSVLTSGTVIVVRIGTTTRERLRRTRERLTQVNAVLYGAVPNGVNPGTDSAYGYNYAYGYGAPVKKGLLGRRRPGKPAAAVAPADLRPALRPADAAPTTPAQPVNVGPVNAGSVNAGPDAGAAGGELAAASGVGPDGLVGTGSGLASLRLGRFRRPDSH